MLASVYVKLYKCACLHKFFAYYVGIMLNALSSSYAQNLNI